MSIHDVSGVVGWMPSFEQRKLMRAVAYADYLQHLHHDGDSELDESDESDESGMSLMNRGRGIRKSAYNTVMTPIRMAPMAAGC